MDGVRSFKAAAKRVLKTTLQGRKPTSGPIRLPAIDVAKVFADFEGRPPPQGSQIQGKIVNIHRYADEQGWMWASGDKQGGSAILLILQEAENLLSDTTLPEQPIAKLVSSLPDKVSAPNERLMEIAKRRAQFNKEINLAISQLTGDERVELDRIQAIVNCCY